MQKIEIIKQSVTTFDNFSIDLSKYNEDGWTAKEFKIVHPHDSSLHSKIEIAVLFEKPDTMDSEKIKQKLNEAKEKVNKVDLKSITEAYTDLLENLEKSLEEVFKEKEK